MQNNQKHGRNVRVPTPSVSWPGKPRIAVVPGAAKNSPGFEQLGSAAQATLDDQRVGAATHHLDEIVETGFAELKDGTLVETIEDPNDARESLLAICKDGLVCYQTRLKQNGRVLVPLSRGNEILRHVRFPRGMRESESVGEILNRMNALFEYCLDLDREQRFLMSAFALSTFFIDQLETAPYIALVGMPRSGKTTALRVLNLLCYRSLLTADITSAAFYQVYEKVTPTLLVDETLTAGEQSSLFHLLRSGSTPGFVAFRKDKSFKAFGAKAVSWIVLPNDAALNSRCIIIPMRESSRADLLRPTDPSVIAIADEIQQRLLRYRLEHYKTLSVPKVRGDEVLRSRTRDLYQALALPLATDARLCESLAECLAKQQDLIREPLPPIAAVVLRVLYQYLHSNPPEGKCRNTDLREGVNLNLERLHENHRVTPHEVGRVLTSLGIAPRKRTNAGYVLLMDLRTRRQIHQLIRVHAIAGPLDGCDLCKELDTSSPTTGNPSEGGQ